MNITKFCLLFVIGLMILPAILSIKISFLPDGLQPGLGSTERVSKEFTLDQSFLSKKDNLAGIGLSIKNPYFRNKKDLLVTIKDEGGASVRQVVLNGSNITDGSFLVIKFDPINDSKNKKFSFELSSPSSDGNESLEIFLSKDVSPAGQKLQVNEKFSDLNLAFVPYYKMSNPLLSWLGIYSSLFLRFMEDIVFFVVYAAVIVSIIFILAKGYLKKAN